MKMLSRPAALCIIVCVCLTELWAQTSSHYDQLARDVLQELVEIKSTESGVGSTPAAEAVARRLVASGFASADVQVIGPTERKKNLVARLRGKAGRPILLLAHLDVVEARREDWSPGLDPFRLTERDGYFYGRGTQDIKGCAAILITNFIRWKQQGWVPDRDLILALTADEEAGNNNGVQWMLQNHRDLIDAEYALNLDSGDFQSKGGKPYIVTLAAAEKKYTAIQLQTVNRGGHGSLPRADNAIYELAAALQRLASFQFPPGLSDITRAQFAGMARLESGQLAEDMNAVAQNHSDAAILSRLSQNPYYNALLRTTCTPTLLEGGHAENALPQRASATLNCRVLPGHSSADVLQNIIAAVADKQVQITWQFNENTDWPASSLRADILATLTKVAQRQWTDVAVMPVLETGASDGRFLRGGGVPTYGVSGVFIDVDDVRSHGRDERIRIRDFYGGLQFYDTFVKALAGAGQATSR